MQMNEHTAGKSSAYIWTRHAEFKLKQYNLSQSRIKRVIRHPDRVEEGIVEDAIAVMQKAGTSKKETEIWALYVIKKEKNNKRDSDSLLKRATKSQLKVISAWRYPGKSPQRDPIPADILQEVRSIVGV